jgi:nitrogen regulatory protein P-II 1
VLCPSEDVDRIVDVIAAASKTGKIGDGKIWWIDVAGILRVRTEERDGDAI